MIDKRVVDDWVEGYIRAWNSNDPAAIAGLFTQDSSYYTSPFAGPWKGRDTIVREWLARKDEPGTFRFRYQVLAAEGDRGVVRGWTNYTAPEREYSNIWVIQFDDQGLCREFTEWWMLR